MIADCPVRGWPDGLSGRRDAFLVVLTETLGLSHQAARDLAVPDLAVPDLTVPDPAADPADPDRTDLPLR